MHALKITEDQSPFKCCDKRDITLKTALLLYPEEDKFSRWFLLDLLVLLFMFLLFMYVQSPERSLFKAPASFFSSHWSGQERTPGRAIDTLGEGLGAGSGGRPGTGAGSKRLMAEAGHYLADHLRCGGRQSRGKGADPRRDKGGVRL